MRPGPKPTPETLCNVPGCANRRAPARLKCYSHIKRKKTYGTYDLPFNAHPPMKILTCMVEGCTSPSHAKYLCNSHYQKAYREDWWKTHERKNRDTATVLEKAALIARNEFYGNKLVGGWEMVTYAIKQDWTRVARALLSFYNRERSRSKTSVLATILEGER